MDSGLSKLKYVAILTKPWQLKIRMVNMQKVGVEWPIIWSLCVILNCDSFFQFIIHIRLENESHLGLNVG